MGSEGDGGEKWGGKGRKVAAPGKTLEERSVLVPRGQGEGEEESNLAYTAAVEW